MPAWQRKIADGRAVTGGCVKSSTQGRRRKSGRPDETIFADIVRRIVEAVNPERIILFGSGARGKMGPNSDIDFSVIKPGKFNRWQLTTAIYRHLRGKGAPVDVVLVTPEEVKLYGDSPYLVIRPALREGKVVYGAETLSSD
jgi:predicted nucleotidyltransferase